jgi:hypothetical protein
MMIATKEEEVTYSLEQRLEGWNWEELVTNLDERGYAKTPALLTSEECEALTKLYPMEEEGLFRSRINMAQYNFGLGEYKYFAYPLPPLIEELRLAFYSRLVPIANSWLTKLGLVVTDDNNNPTSSLYPPTLAEFLASCHEVGQTKPTPLMLHYEKGGYNCLHQDLYGEVAFPLQVVLVLNQRGQDYEGGELLLVEQRPRAQSVGQAITLEKGEGLIFTNRYRPVKSSRGYYRASVRHGVSRLQCGTRYSLGLIFHDAR